MFVENIYQEIYLLVKIRFKMKYDKMMFSYNMGVRLIAHRGCIREEEEHEFILLHNKKNIYNSGYSTEIVNEHVEMT